MGSCLLHSLRGSEIYVAVPYMFWMLLDVRKRIFICALVYSLIPCGYLWRDI